MSTAPAAAAPAEPVRPAGLHADPALDRLRDLVGTEQPVAGWNTEAGRDAVRHFAHGYGDDNPAWGTSAVPPTFLYSVCSGGRAPGHDGPAEVLTGTGALWLSDGWTYHRPVRLSEPITATVRIDALTLKETRSRGPVVLVDEVFTFRDADGTTLADYTKRTMRFRRPSGPDSTDGPDGPEATAPAAAEPVDPWAGAARYTPEELDRIAAGVLAERDHRRGAVPRPAGSVAVGDELGLLVKGPLSLTSVVAWVAGWGSPYIETDRLAHARWTADPALRLVVPSTGRPESIEAPHWDPELAGVAGLPRGYDFGSQRIAWLAHLVTDWAGDTAEVRSLQARLTKPNLLGDLTTLTGEVTAVAGDLVTCTVVARNQRGEQTAEATATVRLPAAP